MQQLPSTDVFIGLAFIIGIAYGFVLKREKTITTLCSVYIGLVVTSSFAEALFNFFNGKAAFGIWIKANASLSTISIVLLLVSIFFISNAINSSSSRTGDLSAFEVLVYSALTVALILASIMEYLPVETRTKYLETSQIANILWHYKTIIVMAGPLSLVILSMNRK